MKQNRGYYLLTTIRKHEINLKKGKVCITFKRGERLFLYVLYLFDLFPFTDLCPHFINARIQNKLSPNLHISER